MMLRPWLCSVTCLIFPSIQHETRPKWRSRSTKQQVDFYNLLSVLTDLDSGFKRRCTKTWEQLLSQPCSDVDVKRYADAGTPRAPSLLLFAIGAIRQGKLAWEVRDNGWSARGQKTTNVNAALGKQYETYMNYETMYSKKLYTLVCTRYH